MNRLTTACSIALLTGSAVVAGAQSAAVNDRPLLFRALSDFDQQDLRGLDGTFTTRNAPSAEFPASFWASARCSGTLVGEEVLFTAGHCFNDHDNDVWIDVGSDLHGTCRNACNITNGQNSADFAVCLMDTSAPVAQFETVNFAPDAVKKDDQIQLTGFGGNQGLGAGTYLIGSTTVTDVLGTDITTKGGVWLFEGDSGGAGFAPFDVSNRRLVAVNSRVKANLETSIVTLLATVKTAVQTWQADQRRHSRAVLICGLDPGAQHCHP